MFPSSNINYSSSDEFDLQHRLEWCLTDIWADVDEPGVIRACMRQISPDRVKHLDWSIIFTPTFKKSVARCDTSMRGRVMLALTELSDSPMVLKGDTIKPLTKDLAGLWRYRIGDYRLVYKILDERKVMLLDFASRDHAYAGG